MVSKPIQQLRSAGFENIIEKEAHGESLVFSVEYTGTKAHARRSLPVGWRIQMAQKFIHEPTVLRVEKLS